MIVTTVSFASFPMLEYVVAGPLRKLAPPAVSLPSWLPTGSVVGVGVGVAEPGTGVGVAAPGVAVGAVLVTFTKLA